MGLAHKNHLTLPPMQWLHCSIYVSSGVCIEYNILAKCMYLVTVCLLFCPFASLQKNLRCAAAAKWEVTKSHWPRCNATAIPGIWKFYINVNVNFEIKNYEIFKPCCLLLIKGSPPIKVHHFWDKMLFQQLGDHRHHYHHPMLIILITTIIITSRFKQIIICTIVCRTRIAGLTAAPWRRCWRRWVAPPAVTRLWPVRWLSTSWTSSSSSSFWPSSPPSQLWLAFDQSNHCLLIHNHHRHYFFIVTIIVIIASIQ